MVPILPGPCPSCLCLPLSVSGAQLNLERNELGPEGVAALAPAIAVSSSVTKILVRNNQLGDAGATVLCDALRQSNVTKVQELDLSFNSIGPDGATAVAAMAGVVASRTHIGEGGLDLRNNQLGDEGWGTIFAGVCSSEVSKIASIDASGEGIGPKGAKLIAEALLTSVNPSLTKIS